MLKYTRQQFFELVICRGLRWELEIQTIYLPCRSNSSQDCNHVDRTNPDFGETVNTTEDLLSYLQLLETGLPLLIVCLVIIALGQIHSPSITGWTLVRSSGQKVVHVWQSSRHNLTTARLPLTLPADPLLYVELAKRFSIVGEEVRLSSLKRILFSKLQFILN